MPKSEYLRPGDVSFAMAHVVEECGEVCAAIGKAQRWGLDSYNPELPPEQRESNAEWIAREITDLRGALDRLEVELANG